jgi:hypothetical protein
MVGESVRASLRDLALQRLGHDHAVVVRFFREQLADAFPRAAPLVVLEGLVTEQESGRRASRVQVRRRRTVLRFHDAAAAPLDQDAVLLSEGLAAELSAAAGKSIILRVENASAIPIESLHGRKDDVGRSVRLIVRGILPRERLGEFSLNPRQGSVRALFVPLGRLQRLLDQPGRANAVIIAGGDAAGAERVLRDAVTVDDFGLRLRALEEQQVLALESRSTIIGDAVAEAAVTAAERLGMTPILTLTYLANSIRSNDREIPYSLVTALDLAGIGLARSGGDAPAPDAIFLNEWAARDLDTRVGDKVAIGYYMWESEGRLLRRGPLASRWRGSCPSSGQLRIVIPCRSTGITDTTRLADWDPPFPIDLRRVRPVDEQYWDRYRTTPKAFISIGRGQALWGSRHGRLTALRVVPAGGLTLDDARAQYERAVRAELAPVQHGFSVYDVRAQSLAASAGATDFGEYFTYFSTFLVVSALLLAGLFFRLGIEQRLQEIGLLQAGGFDPGAIRRLFVAEALVLSIAGGLLGALLAAAYASFIMLGLRTWWVDAVGTTALRLDVAPISLRCGSRRGDCRRLDLVVAAFMAIVFSARPARWWWALNPLRRAQQRGRASR